MGTRTAMVVTAVGSTEAFHALMRADGQTPGLRPLEGGKVRVAVIHKFGTDSGSMEDRVRRTTLVPVVAAGSAAVAVARTAVVQEAAATLAPVFPARAPRTGSCWSLGRRLAVTDVLTGI